MATATGRLLTALAVGCLLAVGCEADPGGQPASDDAADADPQAGEGPDAGAEAGGEEAGEPPREPGQPPPWAREARIYQVFTDRFRDGDPGNNVEVDPAADGSFSEALRNWMGGDLRGVIEGLDHIEAAGFTTIWLSPVSETAAFHGYHPTDLLAVDPSFGSLEELRALVDEAHARDLRVVYDLVLNHTSDEHPWFQDVLAACEDSEHFEWYSFSTCDAEAGAYDYATFLGLEELPQVNLNHGPAQDYVTDVVVPFHLSEEEVALPDGSTVQGLGMDGLRLDHATGPPMAFWEELAEAVAEVDPEAYVFGEVWDSEHDALARYADALHGAVDFPLHFALVDALAGDIGLGRIDRSVREGLEVYGEGLVAPTFLDNHDVERFVHAAGGGEQGRARLAVALTVQYALPGPPIVYNGTEIGMGQSDSGPIEGTLGWRDRWYREPLPWTGELEGGPADWAHADEVDGWTLQEPDLDTLDLVARLGQAREGARALVDGTYDPVVAERELLAFERRDGDDDRVLAIVHDGEEPVEVSLADLYGEAVPDGVTLTSLLDDAEHHSGEGDLAITLDALDAALLAVDGELTDPPD
ncbi:MAG: alpha-amylase family glycosyl hydrolase [Actinomycetota bacterium]